MILVIYMMDIWEKYQKLFDTLEKSPLIKDVKVLNKQVNEDITLQQLLAEYRLNPSMSLKEKIYAYPLYQQYKKLETELNILIFQINFKWKRIRGVEDENCKW